LPMARLPNHLQWGVQCLLLVLKYIGWEWNALPAVLEKPQVLFDYTYDAMDYPFSAPEYRDWLQLFSFLPPGDYYLK
jgi:hypothetical protein